MEEIEVWKSLDFLGYPDYEVSTMGRVKSLPRTIVYKNGRKHTYSEKILKPNKNKYGYLFVLFCKDGKKKMFTIHRLVCLTFLENPLNLPQINHKDENPSNNHVDNLEFCTAKQNSNYGTRNERMSQAKKISILQYTKQDVFIREWDSAKSASIELNIYATSITACCQGKRKTAGGFIWKYKENDSKLINQSI